MRLEFQAGKAAAVAVLIAFGVMQTNAEDWVTAGSDAQRSSWMRTDTKISVKTFEKPDFRLEWKLQPENEARGLNSLMPGVFLDFYIGYKGFRALGFFGASSDRMIAIDTELGRYEWQKSLSKNGSSRAATLTCPGGITAGATRPTTPAYPTGLGGRGFGRSTPAKSGVGEPNEGAVTLNRVQPPRPAPPRRPAGPAAANPFAPRVQWLMALTGDGYLHSMWVSNGNEPKPAVKFLPPGANAKGLIVYDETAYVATTNGCGGVEDGVWSLDLKTAKVNHWTPQSGGVAGTEGAAAGPDGTLYAATTEGELVALEAKTLKQTAVAKVSGVKFTSSPVVFDFERKNVVAVAANDGRVYLFDTAALSNTPLAKTDVFSDADFNPGALASWADTQGGRWLLAASGGTAAKNLSGGTHNGDIQHGAVVAWKVKSGGSGATIEPGWVSRDLLAPIAPIVQNGVVFALASGEFQSREGNASASDIAQKSVPAVLYALDGENGKELWNSGKTIESFVHSGHLAAGETRVYLADYTGTQYAFGVPIPH